MSGDVRDPGSAATAPAAADEVAGPAWCHAQRPRWSPSDIGPGVQCATLDVPLDYADPAGPRITVAVSRRPAGDPSRRRGVLVAFNGGPGGNEGLGLAVSHRLANTPLAEVYDLVGFDARGYGESTPVFAETTARRAAFDTRPADDQFALVAEDMHAAEEGCERAGGTLRRHISTANIARDLDVIRAVLGEERISYLGWAYGTYLGSAYGTLFPDRLDRSVLDSCVHPDKLWHGQFRLQAQAIRANVDAWAAWTGERHTRFGLGRDAAEVLGAVEELAAKLAVEPVHGVSRTVLDMAVGNGATLRPEWTALADLVGGLRAGPTSPLAGPAARAAGDFARHGIRAGTSTAKSARARAAVEAEQTAQSLARQGLVSLRPAVLEAVTSEAEWPSDLEAYYADMREVRASCPYGYGVMRAMPWVSTFRSAPPVQPAVRVAPGDYPTGLIVQAQNDPLNNAAGAEAMAALLGHRLLVVVDEGGHEIYPELGNAAVNDAVTAYLVDGVLPPLPRTEVPGTPRPDIAPDSPRPPRAAASRKEAR
ncbi:alpha/beta fold hydrolase [Streptomyces sp. NPDC087440]|uniref:alpha/beta fold hydrolase n=1 Tax=Streptomyces sp. NPDC087440 TaxID=3365790 RepID=UPI00381C1411